MIPQVMNSPRTSGSKKLLKVPCRAAPFLSHDLLYIRGEERLVCLELIPMKKSVR